MSDDLLQEQARALGDPTRHAIYRAVADADHPIGVAEINEGFELHHNAIRQHLAKLVAAELVVEATAPAAGRGRPPLVYEADPAAEGRWGGTGPYERLSRLLVEMIRTGLDAQEVGRRAAEELRGGSPSGDVVADVVAAMARQGFDPEVRDAEPGTEIVLRACPFATAALADRSTICALHLGIAQGLTDGTEASVVELVAKDPRSADCRLRLRFEPGSTSGTGAPTAADLTLRGRVARRRRPG